MTSPKIVAVETANPPFVLTQKQAFDFVKSRPELNPSAVRWYQRFLLDPGIETRHFGIETLDQLFGEDADGTLSRFEKTAADLGAKALSRALTLAGLKPEDLDGIVVTTCTGYLCPGLTSYIASRVPLRKDIYAVDLAGLGCGAAIPGLRAASLYLEAHSRSYVAVVCVEVCSAAMYWDSDIDLILSNSIFSDGAACAILSSHPAQPGLELKCFGSLLLEEYRDELRFKHRNGRLCNVISPRVPQIASEAVTKLLGLCHEELVDGFQFAAVHPGGRKVLDCMERAIPEFQGNLTASRAVLRQFGNMSSPSVLFVLKKILADGNFQDGDNGVLVSFGAGFTAFGAGVKVCGDFSPQYLSKEIFHEYPV